MREILFRGKRKDNGEWVEGGFFEWQKQPYIVANNTDSFAKTPYEVIPETVGEYIGLTDKSGKKIFEGDILKGYWDTTLIVFYDEISTSYRVKTLKGYEREPSYYGIDKFEVIGNIHDNPELIKQEATI